MFTSNYSFRTYYYGAFPKRRGRDTLIGLEISDYPKPLSTSTTMDLLDKKWDPFFPPEKYDKRYLIDDLHHGGYFIPNTVKQELIHYMRTIGLHLIKYDEKEEDSKV